MFQRILVALDRSDSSRSVLEEAIALAKSAAGQLHLDTVISPMDVGYPDPVYLSLEGMQGVWTTGLYQSHVTSWHQHQQEIEHLVKNGCLSF